MMQVIPQGPVPLNWTMVSLPVQAKWGLLAGMMVMPPALSACDLAARLRPIHG